MLKIGCHTYHVMEAAPSNLISESTMGLMDPVANTVTIPMQAAPTRKATLLLHEAMHAMLCNFNLPHSNDPEEAAVVILSEGVSALLRDNPNLVKFLNWAYRQAEAQSSPSN